MKAALAFWKRDLINKLLVGVSLALVVGAVVVAYATITMVPAAQARDPAALPTVVPMQVTSTEAPTPTTAFRVAETQPLLMITSPTAPTPSGETPTVAATEPALSASSEPSTSCIPKNGIQTGRVVEVLDGNTARVYMDNVVYVVRYIGIQVPRYDEVKQLFGQAALYRNSSLVYGRPVNLIRDVTDRDSAGRLLRYVMVGNTFVNLELLRAGLATASAVAPDTACAEEFRLAEQGARQAQVGRWAGTPTALPVIP